MPTCTTVSPLTLLNGSSAGGYECQIAGLVFRAGSWGDIDIKLSDGLPAGTATAAHPSYALSWSWVGNQITLDFIPQFLSRRVGW